MHNTEKKKKIISVSILICHIKRIGFFRAFIGGLPMYFGIVEFSIIHLIYVIFFYKGLMQSLFKLPSFTTSNYIIIDRHEIEGLHWFDKFNCIFCAYTNGLVILLNDMLDIINDSNFKSVSIERVMIIILCLPILLIFALFNFIFSQSLFFYLSSMQGYHRASLKEINESLKKDNYGSRLHRFFCLILRLTKVYSVRLKSNLEQLESAWCPLKHIERGNSKIPPHHKNFFERDQLDQMSKVLTDVGSVSDRKPRF